MQKKYFFFDIDGTLTNANPGGVILPSTFKTLDALRQNGHFVAIATGRSQSMALPFAEEAGINNMVTDGGNGLTIDNEIVYIDPLDREKCLQVIEECLEKDYPFCLAKDNSQQYYSHTSEFFERGGWPGMSERAQVIENFDYHALPEIYKIFVLLRPEEEAQLESLHGELSMPYSRYHDDHIIIEPEDKFVGIKAMMDHLQAPLEDVVVFGDARNDLTMMEHAAMGIAMGNAIPELKKLANFVTKHCDDDGIEYACKHFGWI